MRSCNLWPKFRTNALQLSFAWKRTRVSINVHGVSASAATTFQLVLVDIEILTPWRTTGFSRSASTSADCAVTEAGTVVSTWAPIVSRGLRKRVISLQLPLGNVVEKSMCGWRSNVVGGGKATLGVSAFLRLNLLESFRSGLTKPEIGSWVKFQIVSNIGAQIFHCSTSAALTGSAGGGLHITSNESRPTASGPVVTWMGNAWLAASVGWALSGVPYKGIF